MDKRILLIVAIISLLLVMSVAADKLGAQTLEGPATIITGSGTIVKPTPTATPTPARVFVPLMLNQADKPNITE